MYIFRIYSNALRSFSSKEFESLCFSHFLNCSLNMCDKNKSFPCLTTAARKIIIVNLFSKFLRLFPNSNDNFLFSSRDAPNCRTFPTKNAKCDRTRMTNAAKWCIAPTPRPWTTSKSSNLSKAAYSKTKPTPKVRDFTTGAKSSANVWDSTIWFA